MKKKNYILRGAGVLLIGALLICSSVATIATTSDKTLLKPIDIKINNTKSRIEKLSSGNVLWDNYIENYSHIIAAQHEPPGTPNRLDVFPADDFMFDVETDVYTVLWDGGYFQCNYAQGPKDYHFDWNITFFEDDGSGNNPGNIYSGPFTILDADIRKSGEYINSSSISNGAWGCIYYASLPDVVTFNSDTKYWITIYGLGETFPQTALARHNESVGGILLHESKIKSEYFGFLDWTNISDAIGEDFPSDLAFALLNQDPDFEVTINNGLGITATIKNQGPLDATNVTATITATGGLVLVGGSKTIDIGDIAIGDSQKAKSMPIGFGRIAIEVQVESFEGMTGNGNTDGILLLFFIL